MIASFVRSACVFFAMLIGSMILFHLGGCVTGTRDNQLDEGRFRVDADCERRRIKVELDLDRNTDKKEVKVTK